MALIFSLTLTTTAFAGQSGEFVFYGNSQVGSVSDGQQGYSWNHSDFEQGRIATIKEIFRKIKKNKWDHMRFYSKNNNGKMHDGHGKYSENRYQNWDNNRDGELNFYVDDNGISHYFYLNPNRNYEVHPYKDDNGITQYSFEDMGWK